MRWNNSLVSGLQLSGLQSGPEMAFRKGQGFLFNSLLDSEENLASSTNHNL